MDGECRKEDVDILGHVEIKREEVFEVLKNIKVDKFPEPGSIPEY